MGLTQGSVFKAFDLRADLLIVNAGAVATLSGAPGLRRRRALGEAGLVRNGAIAVRDGKVLAVGTARAIRAKYSSKAQVDADGGLVTPGFVDPHTHLPFAGNRAFELPLKLAGRSYEEILRAGGGIHRTVKDTRAASQAELVRLLRRRQRTMLAWGTTTAEAKSGYGLNAPTELKQLRAVVEASDPAGVELVPTFLGAHAVPTDAKGGRAGWVQEICGSLIPQVAKEGLAEFVDVFLERSAYDREESREILRTARRHGLGMKLHADEFTNLRGAETAAGLGTTSAEHLLQISKRGIQHLARRKTVAVLLPGVAALGFLDSQAPARAMVDAGVAVALGSDFNPNCPVLTMPTVLQWGVYELRLTPSEALAACTTNAAHAIGRGDRIGRIEPGYQADILVHRVPSVDELAYWVGPNPVRTVVKNGRVVPTSRDPA
jgi:imidazolonepropionase